MGLISQPKKHFNMPGGELIYYLSIFLSQEGKLIIKIPLGNSEVFFLFFWFFKKETSSDFQPQIGQMAVIAVIIVHVRITMFKLEGRWKEKNQME